MSFTAGCTRMFPNKRKMNKNSPRYPSTVAVVIIFYSQSRSLDQCASRQLTSVVHWGIGNCPGSFQCPWNSQLARKKWRITLRWFIDDCYSRNSNESEVLNVPRFTVTQQEHQQDAVGIRFLRFCPVTCSFAMASNRCNSNRNLTNSPVSSSPIYCICSTAVSGY